MPAEILVAEILATFPARCYGFSTATCL